MKRDHIIDKIKEKMKMLVPKASIILFGSEARGEARIDSDIDLLFLIPDEYNKIYNEIRIEIMNELYLLELEFNVLISPIVLLQKMWDEKVTPFTINVEKDGILL